MGKTIFTNLDNNKISESTTFNSFLHISSKGVGNILKNPTFSPKDYDFVDFIGNDTIYGDVFRASNKKTPNTFVIYFGKKGNEFN